MKEEKEEQMEGGAEAPPAAAAPQQGGEQGAGQDQAMLQAVGEMGDQLIKMIGLDGLAQVLEEALREAQGGQRQAPPQGGAALPSPAPTPGGEAFGPAFG